MHLQWSQGFINSNVITDWLTVLLINTMNCGVRIWMKTELLFLWYIDQNMWGEKKQHLIKTFFLYVLIQENKWNTWSTFKPFCFGLLQVLTLCYVLVIALSQLMHIFNKKSWNGVYRKNTFHLSSTQDNMAEANSVQTQTALTQEYILRHTQAQTKNT